MKIVGIIPSRYNSTRFPGKALAPFEGRPMICRVCEAAVHCTALDAVYVATDSLQIKEVCEAQGFSVIMTGNFHKNPTSRVKEASDIIKADLYVMIGGDEPLILPEDIRTVVNLACAVFTGSTVCDRTSVPYVVNAMTAMESMAEILDPANIKVVCNGDNEGLYTSRHPLPYAKEALSPLLPYRKFVSIGVYTKEALDFFVSTPEGLPEQAEECDLLRFLEHRKTVLFTDIRHHTLSVDTPADLERVKQILCENSDRRIHEISGNSL